MNCKVSIIIPVYNVEEYLEECVHSVIQQTYKDIEVILIDDGSKDGSGVLCDKLEGTDERIIVIHQENGGLSAARNTGITNATGDYLIFVDSDDFLDDPEALQRIVDRVKDSQAEVLNYSYKKYYESRGEKKPQFSGVQAMPLQCDSKEKQLNYIVGNSLFIASACNKMIARSVFERDMYFEKGKLSEDIEWCAKLLERGETFDFICENFYCYRQREGSISHSIGEKTCVDLKDNILGCLRIAKGADDRIKQYIFQYTAYQLSTFVAIQAYPKKRPKECIKELSRYRNVLKYHANNRKVRILNGLSSIIGFSGLCRLVRLTKKIWAKE